MAPLADGHLQTTTFFASSHDNDQCGSNGLPLTPNSIRIIGRFQLLTTIEHQNLCTYIDLIRGKREHIIVVSEGHDENLLQHFSLSLTARMEKVHRIAYEILCGLNHLHSQKVTHRNIAMQNIQLDSKGTVKMSYYGLYHMTENGASVSFPVGNPVYMAPEVFLNDCELLPTDGVAMRRTLSSSDETELLNPASAPNVDSWSLGVVLLQYIAGEQLWPDTPMCDVISSLLQLFLDNVGCAYERLLREFSSAAQQNFQAMDSELVNLVKACLVVNPSVRLRASALLSHTYFTVKPVQAISTLPHYKPMKFNSELRCANLTIEDVLGYADEDMGDDYFHLKERSYQEIYCLWRLTGGDLVSVLKKDGLITNTPPIINMNNYVSDEGDTYGATQDFTTMYSDSSVTLDLSQLYDRLSEVDPEDYYPLVISDDARSVKRSVSETAKLPLIIRERDVEYQFHRIVLLDVVLKGYPYTKARLLKEARIDIPPLFRAPTWAAILDVQGDIYEKYDSIDKVTAATIDRQIEVDIPRCHQYNELMSSPEAHKKLKRVLKAWVTSHPQYVYWQGLDSLSAPFIYLNFNDEAMAYACLSKFISKYLYNFFLRDNSAVIQEYLAMFSQLICFHEPELSNHLEETGFSPDLYAIPWFLTMYAHVFPLHRLFHLWDTLLLGASVFPLCIGVAILQQLKARLLTYGFNECILLFSDLPEINIEQCVNDSIRVFRSTPKSSAVRVHAPPLGNKRDTLVDNRTANEKLLVAEPLPLTELKTQRCLKISAEEMLSLLSPSADMKQSKPKLIVIDIRTVDEYQKGTIPDALHVSASGAFTPDGHFSSSAAKEFLDEHRYQVKVVVDTNNSQSGKFAAALVSLGYSKVCYLHKAYPSHSYYGSGGEVRQVANQAACGWSHPHTQTHANLPSVFDYYPHSEYYSYPSLPSHCVGVSSTASTPSPHGFESASSNYWGSSTDSTIYAQLAGERVYSPYAANGKKKGVASNSKKERRRTISINGAFSSLRDCIPNVPKDTKLSKIKTLRLACGYIQHLMDALSSDTLQPMQEFKADLSRKTPCRAEKRKCIEAEIAAAADRKSRGRSGWPQTIWAQDLKGEGTSVTDYLPMKSFLSSDAQAALPPLSKIKTEHNSASTHLDIADVPDPCASCHSSFCEESSSNAGSLG